MEMKQKIIGKNIYGKGKRGNLIRNKLVNMCVLMRKLYVNNVCWEKMLTVR
jgi:hypothetical protein